MTEAEWQKCGDPEKMWKFLRHMEAKGNRQAFRLSDRKKGLWCEAANKAGKCSLSTRVYKDMALEHRIDHAIQCLPVHGRDDERINRERCDLLRCVAGSPFVERPRRSCQQCGGVGHWIIEEIEYPEGDLGWTITTDLPVAPPLWKHRSREACGRCSGEGTVVGLPPEVLAWRDGTIPRIARRIYDEQEWGDLPVLADALEEAGLRTECSLCKGRGSIFMGAGTVWAYDPPCKKCSGTGASAAPHPLLLHLRGGGPHCRGCWCVDLCLSEE